MKIIMCANFEVPFSLRKGLNLGHGAWFPGATGQGLVRSLVNGAAIIGRACPPNGVRSGSRD